MRRSPPDHRLDPVPAFGLSPQATDRIELPIRSLIAAEVARQLAGANNDRWLSRKDAAMYLGVSIDTIKRNDIAGRIPGAYGAGRLRRYRQSGLDKFQEGRSQPIQNPNEVWTASGSEPRPPLVDEKHEQQQPNCATLRRRPQGRAGA